MLEANDCGFLSPSSTRWVQEFVPASSCLPLGRPWAVGKAGTLSCSSLEELEQILVDIIWDEVGKGMCAARVDLQAAALEKLDGFVGTGHNGNDLIVIARENQLAESKSRIHVAYKSYP